MLALAGAALQAFEFARGCVEGEKDGFLRFGIFGSGDIYQVRKRYRL